ncbi:hypothetical protein Tco_0046398 [Tanacetum coccineum]
MATNHPPKAMEGFDLKGYSDSDYAGYNMDKKSTSGACQILGGKLVCWSAKRHQSVAMSSAKAEYVAAAGCCASILWMKSQLSDHDIHYKMDHILKGDIKLHFILTEYQLADIFTKPLDEPTFTRLKAELGMLNIEEFWSTAVAYDPFPSTDETEQRPLREFLIKFSVLNGQRPLTLDFNTFCSSTGLRLLRKKWAKSHQFDFLGVSPPPLSAKPKKGKSQTVTPTLPQTQGP